MKRARRSLMWWDPWALSRLQHARVKFDGSGVRPLGPSFYLRAKSSESSKFVIRVRKSEK